MIVNLDVVLYVCGAVVTVAAAFGVVAKAVSRTVRKGVENTVKKIVSDSSGQVCVELKVLAQRLDEYIEASSRNDEQLKQALLNLIRDRINQAHVSYMRKKTIGTYSLATLEELYHSYKILGGNSFIEHEMNDLHTLKVVSAEEIIKTQRREEYVGEDQKDHARHMGTDDLFADRVSQPVSGDIRQTGASVCRK